MHHTSDFVVVAMAVVGGEGGVLVAQGEELNTIVVHCACFVFDVFENVFIIEDVVIVVVIDVVVVDRRPASHETSNEAFVVHIIAIFVIIFVVIFIIIFVIIIIIIVVFIFIIINGERFEGRNWGY